MRPKKEAKNWENSHNIYNQQRIIILPIITKRKGNSQLKFNKKHQQIFHRRGTWITFEYMRRCSNSKATPEAHVDVSITYCFPKLCVGKNVEQWEHSSTTHELKAVADTLEERMPVCNNGEQVHFHS